MKDTCACRLFGIYRKVHIFIIKSCISNFCVISTMHCLPFVVLTLLGFPPR